MTQFILLNLIILSFKSDLAQEIQLRSLKSDITIFENLLLDTNLQYQ
jgi:hypothetical protein